MSKFRDHYLWVNRDHDTVTPIYVVLNHYEQLGMMVLYKESHSYLLGELLQTTLDKQFLQ
jgi:hypothetical protein